MLQRVSIEGVRLPRLYIAEDNQDVMIAKQNGIPYVKWRHGQEKLVKMLLRPTLEKLFPGINWNKVLGTRKPVHSLVYDCPGSVGGGEHLIASYDAEAMLEAQFAHDEVVDQVERDYMEHVENEDGELVRWSESAVSERECASGGNWDGYDTFEHGVLTIEDYVGDLSSSVDLEAIYKLGLMPKFMGDVYDCVRSNLSQRMRWTEGYNKKLRCPIGKFDGKRELPTLVTIDCSHSIPDGIAATMLTLADTIRSVCNAELIITSRRSGYYPVGSELPSPQTLRDYYGRSNESHEFMAILEKHIAGREFGHVISFGDNDCPGSISSYHPPMDYSRTINMAGTKVHAVHHYHTTYDNTPTGYARWVDEICPNAEHYYDTSWCKVMRWDYRM